MIVQYQAIITFLCRCRSSSVLNSLVDISWSIKNPPSCSKTWSASTFESVTLGAAIADWQSSVHKLDLLACLDYKGAAKVIGRVCAQRESDTSRVAEIVACSDLLFELIQRLFVGLGAAKVGIIKAQDSEWASCALMTVTQ